jgi:hypothetical protein
MERDRWDAGAAGFNEPPEPTAIRRQAGRPRVLRYLRTRARMSTVWNHKPETNDSTSSRPGIHARDLAAPWPIPGRHGAIASPVDEVVGQPLTPADIAVFPALASAALAQEAGTTGSLIAG